MSRPETAWNIHVNSTWKPNNHIKDIVTQSITTCPVSPLVQFSCIGSFKDSYSIAIIHSELKCHM